MTSAVIKSLARSHPIPQTNAAKKYLSPAILMTIPLAETSRLGSIHPSNSSDLQYRNRYRGRLESREAHFPPRNCMRPRLLTEQPSQRERCYAVRRLATPQGSFHPPSHHAQS